MAQPNKMNPAKVLEQALELPGQVAPYYSYFDTSKGGALSLTNMITLYEQGAREIVGTRTQWGRVERTPTADAERYYIWVPIIVKTPNKDGEIEEVFTGRFRPVWCMYVYSQTEGEALKPKEAPGWSLAQMLGRMAIRQTEFKGQYGGIQGYSYGTEMAISPIAADPLGTALHEAAHILLGHTIGAPPDEPGGKLYHRGLREYQAEAVRYLVKNELGLLDDQDATYSRGYLHHWLSGEQPPEQACRQVLLVADRMLRAGRVDTNFDTNAAPNTP